MYVGLPALVGFPNFASVPALALIPDVSTASVFLWRPSVFSVLASAGIPDFLVLLLVALFLVSLLLPAGVFTADDVPTFPNIPTLACVHIIAGITAVPGCC